MTDTELIRDLRELIDGEVAADPATLKRYSRDTSLFEVRPRVVVFPKSPTDVEKLVLYVQSNLEAKLSLTARSGGTDMSGGDLNESIIVDMHRYLTKIGTVHRGEIETEPGAYYRHFERATLKKKMLLPSYPASREIATIGGMISNNSGGEKTLRYGKTERYVTELDVVLSDGQTATFKPLTLKELDGKFKQDDLEGEIYRKMYRLVQSHHKMLQEAKPKVSKNSSGYFLWNIWDGKHFDLTKLIVGSQGTLGIITRAKIRLVPVERHQRMLIIFLKDFEPLAKLVPQVLEHNPESFESYDDHTLKFAIRYLPSLMRQMKGNVFSLALQFLPELKVVMTSGMPKLVLMAEFTGDSLKEVNAQVKAAHRELQTSFPHLRMMVTKSRGEGRKYWVVRRESFNLLRKHVHHKHTAPFIDDLCVRPDQLPTFLPELNEIMSHYDLTYTIAGHIGDANFHIIPLMNLADPKQRAIIPELSKKVYALAFKYGGTISGEHGDGLIRTPYLREMYGPRVYKLFEETKAVFDPENIFNPGKKVGGELKYSLEHLIKD